MINEALIRQFHDLMVETYVRAANECDYRPVRFLQMVTERGGLATAQDLLRSSRPAEGLSTLWERKRLDLSVEALVCQEPWRTLFTEEEIKIARKRLTDLGYVPPT
jgi:hypothetical protein